MNSLKFIMDLFVLLETMGVTLLGPVLAKLPKFVRIGPLAPTETYSVRDWAITNALSFYFATGFYIVNYKFLMGTWGRDVPLSTSCWYGGIVLSTECVFLTIYI